MQVIPVVNQKPYHAYFKKSGESCVEDHFRGGQQYGAYLQLFCCGGWAVSGVFLHFSEKWATFIQTLSSVITILMVFLIQKTQNKDSLAIQLKLNELVAAHGSASNRLVNVEGMTEEELKVIQKYYTRLSEFAKKQDTLTESHSIDEQHKEHEIRKEMEQELKELE